MLAGKYKHSIDEKGRTSLPAKFKKEVGKNVAIVPGFDGSIDVYTPQAWADLNEKLINMKGEKGRIARRDILGASDLVEADKQGRILIKQELKDHAGLDSSKVIWVGVGDKAEIWSEERFENYMEKTPKNSKEISDLLEDII